LLIYFCEVLVTEINLCIINIQYSLQGK
jgi:hypothetical protein